MSTTLDTGRNGELAAQEYLKANGFELLHTNWRSGRYELDIVAEKDGTLHIVEVKTRKPGSLTAPEEAMTRKKFDALSKAAGIYVVRYGITGDVQFDLISVEFEGGTLYNIRYIPDVMSSLW